MAILLLLSLLAGWALLAAAAVSLLAERIGMGWALASVGGAHFLLALIFGLVMGARMRAAERRRRQQMNLQAMAQVAAAVIPALKLPKKGGGVALGIGLIALAAMLAQRGDKGDDA